MSLAFDFEATVLSVILAGPSVSARYRRPDGDVGSTLILPAEYGAGYWPPAVGDVIRVRPLSVELVARPRGGA